ncbi:AsmA family protein [Geobacter sp. AOG1]|uniref:AsmA family protein n=1 Tax=Geobacter sp. AOG1 TaxID=1566346 RepID=UPI001CC627A4|nr:AsmA family protein [Geobacter sp. AOG1]GFE58007.1 hypothetical protein AOG1_18870 [Geobacter sp. AOG1]
MTGNEAGKDRGRVRKVLAGAVLAVLLICAVATVSLKLYLATPDAAGRLSRLASARLHQPVRVAGLRLAGDTLYIQGVTVANTPGFTGSLAAVDSLAISPRWPDLLRGEVNFRRIALEGVKLDLRSDSTGTWNFAPLRQSFAGGKPSAKGVTIHDLTVKRGTILVNGRGVEDVSLRLSDLATRGGGDAPVTLDFGDQAGNRYRVEGKVRPGSDPAFYLTLTAPSLSLAPFVNKVRGGNLFKGGRGSLTLTAVLREGKLRTTGHAGVDGLHLVAGNGATPLAGTLDIDAGYDMKRGEVRLEKLALSLNDMLRVRATGTVGDLRGAQLLTLDLLMDEMDLGRVSPFVPALAKSGVSLGGKLAAQGIRLAGNKAQGVISAGGTLSLRDGKVARGELLLANGLAGNATLAGDGKGIRVKGRLSQPHAGGTPLLETLDAPFSVILSARFKPLLAEIPSLAARIMGLPITGRAAFAPSAAEPFTVALQLPPSPLAAFNPFLDRFGLKNLAGNASLAVTAGGRTPREFNGTAQVRLTSLKGSRGTTSFALGDGTADARFGRSAGDFTVTGTARLDGVAVGRKKGEGRFGFRFADGVATVEKGAFQGEGISLAVERATCRLSAGDVGSPGRRPLAVDLTGVDLHRGDLDVAGLAATLRGLYAADDRGKWLEGTAAVAAGKVLFRGKEVASPSVRLFLARPGWRGELGGTLLGGGVNGTVTLNPFDREEGYRFQVGVQGGQLAKVGALLPAREAVTLAGGEFSVTGKGSYSTRGGLACGFDSKGENISLTGKGGKSLLAGGGIRLAGEIGGRTLSLNEGVITVGEGVILTTKGSLANFTSPEREGRFTCVLARTTLNRLIDPFVNILPRALQEATTEGELAAEGTIQLHAGEKLVNGTLLLNGVRLEVASQKLAVADVSGKVPFSLDFSKGAPPRPADSPSFSRENYPQLLARFNKSAGSPDVTIGSVHFGPLSLGRTTLELRAGNGLTEIVSLRSSLYEGAILGRGFVAVKGGAAYGGDLLINDLSLRQFCDAIPKIKGYILGKVDGIVSLYGEGKGIGGLTGFVDLWAREGKGEKMLVSKEFLQKLAGKKLRGYFFRDDRPYDQAEISAELEEGFLTFETLDISHTNLIGIRDLSVSVAPIQNRIALDHLLEAVKQAAARGKAATATGEPPPAEAPASQEFKWEE